MSSHQINLCGLMSAYVYYVSFDENVTQSLFSVYPWGNGLHPHCHKPVQTFTAGTAASHPRDVSVRRSLRSRNPRQLSERRSVRTKGAGPHTLDRCAHTYVTGDTFSPTETHTVRTPTNFLWQQDSLEGVVWKSESTDRKIFLCVCDLLKDFTHKCIISS